MYCGRGRKSGHAVLAAVIEAEKDDKTILDLDIDWAGCDEPHFQCHFAQFTPRDILTGAALSVVKIFHFIKLATLMNHVLVGSLTSMRYLLTQVNRLINSDCYSETRKSRSELDGHTVVNTSSLCKLNFVNIELFRDWPVHVPLRIARVSPK